MDSLQEVIISSSPCPVGCPISYESLQTYTIHLLVEARGEEKGGRVQVSAQVVAARIQPLSLHPQHISTANSPAWRVLSGTAAMCAILLPVVAAIQQCATVAQISRCWKEHCIGKMQVLTAQSDHRIRS